MDHDVRSDWPRVATVAQSRRTLDDVPLDDVHLDDVLVEPNTALRGKPAGGINGDDCGSWSMQGNPWTYGWEEQWSSRQRPNHLGTRR